MRMESLDGLIVIVPARKLCCVPNAKKQLLQGWLGSVWGKISSLHLKLSVELLAVFYGRRLHTKPLHRNPGLSLRRNWGSRVQAPYDLVYSEHMVTSWKSFHAIVPSEAGSPHQYPLDATTFAGADIGAQINWSVCFTSGRGPVLLPSSATTYVATTQITVRAFRLLLEALTLQVAAPILCADRSGVVGIGIRSIITPSGHTGPMSYAVTNVGNIRLGEGKATGYLDLRLSSFYIDANATGNTVHSLGGSGW